MKWNRVLIIKECSPNFCCIRWRVYETIISEKIPEKSFRRQLVNAKTNKETSYPLNLAEAKQRSIWCGKKRWNWTLHWVNHTKKMRNMWKSPKIQCSKHGKTPHLKFCFLINPRLKFYKIGCRWYVIYRKKPSLMLC